MKKIIFFVLIFFIYNNTKAQNISGGVIAGVTASQVSGDQLSGFNKAGLLFGGYANTFFTKKSGFKMELIYIQKGSKKNPDAENQGDFESYRLNLQYVELPVLYQFKANERFTLDIGTSISVLIKSKEEINSYEYNDRKFNKLEFSSIIGGTFNIIENWSFMARWTNTLFFTPIRDHASGAKRGFNWGQENTVLSFAFVYTLK